MEDLSLHILDIVENSLAAGGRRITIRLQEDTAEDRMSLEIIDDGCGMNAETRQRALDPFFTTKTTRRFGLGLPLLEESCRICNGQLSVESGPGQGTRVWATFQRSHIDCKPLGNMGDTLIALIVGHPEVDILYEHRKDGLFFSLDTREVRDGLGDIPLNEPQVVLCLRDHIQKGLQELGG